MTHRSYLNRRKRKFFILFAACWLGAIACSFLSAEVHDTIFFGTLALVLASMILLYWFVTFGVKCPSCGGQWGWIAIYSGSPVAIRRRLRLCPYCGVGLDEPVTTDQRQ